MPTRENLLYTFINQLSNREIAIGFWMFVILLIAFRKSKGLAKSLWNVAVMLFASKVSIRFYALLAYNALIILMLYQIGYRDISLLSITVLVVVFGCVPFLLNECQDFLHEKLTIKDIIKKNIALVVLIEFIYSFYSFHLAIEIVFVPVVTILLFGYYQHTGQQEYKHLAKGYEFLFAILLGILSIYGLYMLITNFNTFSTLETTKKFMFPIIFGVLQIPYMYILALVFAYENLFVHISKYTREKGLYSYTVRKLIRFCYFDFYKLKSFSKYVGNIHASTRQEIDELVGKYKSVT